MGSNFPCSFPERRSFVLFQLFIFLIEEKNWRFERKIEERFEKKEKNDGWISTDDEMMGGERINLNCRVFLEFWIGCERRGKNILSERKTVNHGSVAESGRRWIPRLARFPFFPWEEYFMQTRCFPSQETISPRGWSGERNLIKFSKTREREREREARYHGHDNYSINRNSHRANFVFRLPRLENSYSL